jgi:chemotaxis response regulator CheB
MYPSAAWSSLQLRAVVAQHLDPTRVSHLQEILGRAGPLAVGSVADQEPLRTGVVHVVPANRHVQSSDQHVGLTNEARGRLLATDPEA